MTSQVLVVEEQAVTLLGNVSSLHWRAVKALPPVSVLTKIAPASKMRKLTFCAVVYALTYLSSLKFSLGYWWPHLGRRAQAKVAQKCYCHVDIVVLFL